MEDANWWMLVLQGIGLLVTVVKAHSAIESATEAKREVERANEQREKAVVAAEQANRIWIDVVSELAKMTALTGQQWERLERLQMYPRQAQIRERLLESLTNLDGDPPPILDPQNLAWIWFEVKSLFSIEAAKKAVELGTLAAESRSSLEAARSKKDDDPGALEKVRKRLSATALSACGLLALIDAEMGIVSVDKEHEEQLLQGLLASLEGIRKEIDNLQEEKVEDGA